MTPLVKDMYKDLHDTLVESGYTTEQAWTIIEKMFGGNHAY